MPMHNLIIWLVKIYYNMHLKFLRVVVVVCSIIIIYYRGLCILQRAITLILTL